MVLEFKNAANEDAVIRFAFQQLQTYKAEIPASFATNAVLVISDDGGRTTKKRAGFDPAAGGAPDAGAPSDRPRLPWAPRARSVPRIPIPRPPSSPDFPTGPMTLTRVKVTPAWPPVS